jgi:hypothetical protein
MKKIQLTGLVAVLLSIQFAPAQNPFVRDIYTADPSAHVWADGRLYVYPSHDISPPRGCDLMDKYHVYSTGDMVNWTDHGQILEASDVPWGNPLVTDGKPASFMWAPDCAYKNGKYYFYFPHPSDNPWGSNWKIGVAVSDKPASDFTVLDEPLKGLPDNGMIDPCVFIDDDGQAYFYYGGGGVCRGGKLKENMTEIEGELQQMRGLLNFHEGAWVHKKGDYYYLSYPGNNSNLKNYVAGQDQLLYAIADNPLGPWDYKGPYLGPTGCDTSHGSIVEYNDQWYAFYHSVALSGTGLLRSICVDPLYYEDDGVRIKMVKQTKDCGSPYDGISGKAPGTVEAEDFNEGKQGIAYFDKTQMNIAGEYRPREWVDIDYYYATDAYYITQTEKGEYTNYTIDVSETGWYEIDCLAASAGSKEGEFYLQFDGETKTNTLTIPLNGALNFQAVTTRVFLTQGEQNMTFYPLSNLNIDKFVFNYQGVGIKTVTENPLIIYPNPSGGSFQIKHPEPGIVSVSDSSGKLILKERLNDSDHAIDISTQAPGMYVLSLQTALRKYQSKLIKQ